MTAAERLAATMQVPTSSRFLDAGGFRLHCLVAGSGTPIVLVHGLNVGWGQWHEVIGPLSRRHKVFALDMPGAGESEKIDFLAAGFASAYLHALDGALRALVPGGATVVAHSLGAWAALKLAAQNHPSIRRLEAVSPLGLTQAIPPAHYPLTLRPLARLIAGRALPPTRENIRSVLAGVTAVSSTAPEYVDYVVEHVNRPPLTHPLLLMHRLLRPFRLREEFILGETELVAIRIPVLFIHGAADPLIPLGKVRRAFDRVPGARTVVLEGVGHVPPLERHEEFSRLTGEFAETP